MQSSELFAPEGLENALENYDRTGKEGRAVDEGTEGQYQVSQGMPDDRSPSSCSQNEVSESLLRHDDEGDYQEESPQCPEYTHVEGK